MENQRTNPAHIVRKNLYALILRAQKRFQVLTVVHSGIRDHVLMNQFVALVHINMVLVSEETAAVLFGPAGTLRSYR